MTPGGKWADLGPRLISSVLLAAVAIAAIVAGGPWFAGLCVVAAGVMLWELAAMIRPEKRRTDWLIGLGGAAAVLVAVMLPGAAGLVALALPAGVGAFLLGQERRLFAAYGLAIMVAAWGLTLLRNENGIAWLAWLVSVVVVTDVAGYFAGRALGGPKFWPRISPKKTWSGTVAGWIAAAVVGFLFEYVLPTGHEIVIVSAVLAFASQMGDIAESAIKRRMGVKDSSRLLPGHGGLMDRFDGLLGATLAAMMVVELLLPVRLL
jgi:phosphatidate cytidylyltransferase